MAVTRALASQGPNLGVTNQYANDIDPSTAEGAKLLSKMQRASNTESDKLKVTLDDAKKTIDHFIEEADRFAWGKMVNAIPTEFKEETSGGSTTVVVSKKSSILTGFSNLTLEDVQYQASTIFGFERYPTNQTEIDARTVPDEFKVRTLSDNTNQEEVNTYFRRIRSIAIAENIQNTIDADTFETLKQSEVEYIWVTDDGERMRDGPTMLYLLCKHITPSTKVKTIAYQTKIETMRLDKYGHDVTKYLTAMEATRIEAERKGGAIANYTLHVFNGLLCPKTVLNKEFRGAIQRKRDDWEEGDESITAASLIVSAKNKYNNLVSREMPGGKNAWTASVAEKDKLMALTTQVSQLRKELADTKSGKNGSGGGSGGGGSGGGSTSIPRITDWNGCRRRP